MKILHVDTGLTWRGGQQQVFYLHQGLSRRGIETRLACSRGGELERRAAAAGLPVMGLPVRGEWDLLSALRLAREIRRRGVTHLHLHSSHAQTLGIVAARVAGRRNVIVTRRVDFVPRAHVFNHWKYGNRILRFIAISRAIREILERFGVPPERIRLVSSGVDLDRARPGSGEAFRRELGVEDSQLLVGNVAHLADHKGQRYLVEAIPLVLERRPEARFVIVGEGELEESLKSQARELGIGDRLVFTGFRPDVPEIMDALDVFAMPSHLEGLGTIVLDALVAGKPVVAAAAGGIPDIIEHERHGLLVPPRDPAALAAAIVRLLGDRELGCRLAGAGLARVKAEFSVDAMVEGNLGVYRELGA